MLNQRIGALLIGQSPRPDLVEPLMDSLPACEVIQAGALDDVNPNDLPKPQGIYPLITRMGGMTVKVEEEYLKPKLQAALDRLEMQDVSATILMCAGTFLNLAGKKPLIKPFELGCMVLRALGIESIGLIAPFEEQEKPISQRWSGRSFTTTVWTADISMLDRVFHMLMQEQIGKGKFQAVVLDFVGHPRDHVQQLRKTVELPVLDIGQLAISMLASTICK